jgi:predicted enzyme related to lactoylglutathione lyase
MSKFSTAEGAAPPKLEVGIVVADLEAVTPFYRDGLGLTHVTDLELPFGVQRRFAWGDGIVKLVQFHQPPTTSNPPGGLLGGATGLRYFSLNVDDIDQVLARCEQAGGKVAYPMEEYQPGLKVMVVEDRDENCWVEVVCRAR